MSKQKPEPSKHLQGHCLTLAPVEGAVGLSRSLLPSSQDLAGGRCSWGLRQYKYVLCMANHTHSRSMSTFHQVLFTERETETLKRTVYPANIGQTLAVANMLWFASIHFIDIPINPRS